MIGMRRCPSTSLRTRAYAPFEDGLVEMPRIGLARKRTDDLLHLPGPDQRREPRVAVAGVVVDDREPLGALCDQRGHQRRGHPCASEPADEDGGAVGDVGDGRFEGGNDFIDHSAILGVVPHFSRRSLANSG